MEKVLIMCRSMTQAQRSQRLLERSGLLSTLIKAPVSLTRSGCGYALVLRRHGEEAVRILREAGMLGGKVYRQWGEGWEEVRDDLP